MQLSIYKIDGEVVSRMVHNSNWRKQLQQHGSVVNTTSEAGQDKPTSYSFDIWLENRANKILIERNCDIITHTCLPPRYLWEAI